MGKRQSEIPLEKITLKLFKGDAEEMRKLYPTVGASGIIRELVRSHIRRVHEEAQKNSPVVPGVNVEI